MLTTIGGDVFKKAKEIQNSRINDYMGFVYVIEWGNLVKIGCTMHPYTRLTQLKRQSELYGDCRLGVIALSQAHTNFRENEKRLHKHFQTFRKDNTELFNVSIGQVIDAFPKCTQYLDESEKLDQKGKAVCEFAKQIVLGGLPTNSNNIHGTGQIATEQIAQFIQRDIEEESEKQLATRPKFQDFGECDLFNEIFNPKHNKKENGV